MKMYIYNILVLKDVGETITLVRNKSVVKAKLKIELNYKCSLGRILSQVLLSKGLCFLQSLQFCSIKNTTYIPFRYKTFKV